MNIDPSKLVLGVSGPHLNQQYMDMQGLLSDKSKDFNSQKYSGTSQPLTKQPYGAAVKNTSQSSNQKIAI